MTASDSEIEVFRPKALIYDMFSTLVEMVEPPCHVEALATALDRSPNEVRNAAEAIHTKYEEGLVSPRAQVERMREVCATLGVTAVSESRAKELIKIEANAFAAVTRLYPGVPEMLRYYHDHGIKQAICSNVTYIGLGVAATHGLRGMVDYAAFSCEVGAKKPDKRIYQNVMTHLGVKASECLFSDDHPGCVRGAEAVGMHGVLVLHTDGVAAHNPGSEREFDTIAKITDLQGMV